MAKTKVDISGLQKLTKSIQRTLGESVNDQDLLREISDFSVKRIKGETRRGKDLSRNGADQPEYSDFTKVVKRLVRTGVWKMEPPPLSGLVKPNLSNLTMTGQLLDSVVGNIRARLGQVEITVEGSRTATKLTVTKTGKLIQFKNKSEINTNKGLARKLAEEGRTFLGMDEKGITLIRRLALASIRRKLKQSRFVAKP